MGKISHIIFLSSMIACGAMLSCDDLNSQGSTAVSDVSTIEDATGSTVDSNTTKMTAAEQKDFFKTYVSIGDSLTQGNQGVNVEENRQFYSWPAQLARAIGTEFNQPLIEFPGIGIPNPEDALRKGWWDTWSSTISCLIKGLLYWHRVDRYAGQARLNNFAISGATIDDMLSYDGTKKITEIAAAPIMSMVGMMNPWICSVVGLQPAKVKSAVDQALDRDPTFISVWIGTNDSIFGSISADSTGFLVTGTDAWKSSWDILVAKIKAKKIDQGCPSGQPV